jgi:RNA polymerase primary sigma factor
MEDPSLDEYLCEIDRYPWLTRDQEMDLLRRVREGCDESLDRLARCHLRCVVPVARMYDHRGMSLPDLINEGNLGLIRAAHRFDHRRGLRFSTHAFWWIRRTILEALRR